MAFAGSTSEDKGDSKEEAKLFHYRFNRKLDQHMKKILKDFPVPSGEASAQPKAPQSPTPNSIIPLSKRKRTAKPSVYSQLLSAFPKGRRARRRLVEDSKPPTEALGLLSQVASDLRTLFAKAPTHTREPHPPVQQIRQVSPKASNPLPRISVSSTPRRQPVPPSDTSRSKSQHRPKVSARRIKDQVDLVGFQQFFADFHEKSRNLLHQLEVSVIKK